MRFFGFFVYPIMKTFTISFIISIFLFTTATAHASSTSAPQIYISADIATELTLELIAMDENTHTTMSSLDFGQLLRTDTDLRSSKVCKVLLKVSGTGVPLELVQIASDLAVRGNTDVIPKGAFMMRPAYLAADNGGVGMPPGSQVAGASSVYGRQLLYRDPTGSSRIISVFYTLSGDPSTGASASIPLEQKTGDYSGNIQYTLTTI
jgi:hypothetical protein